MLCQRLPRVLECPGGLVCSIIPVAKLSLEKTYFIEFFFCVDRDRYFARIDLVFPVDKVS